MDESILEVTNLGFKYGKSSSTSLFYSDTMASSLKYEPPLFVPFQATGGSLAIGYWSCKTGTSAATEQCKSGWQATKICGSFGCSNTGKYSTCVTGSTDGGCQEGLDAMSVCSTGTRVNTGCYLTWTSCCTGSSNIPNETPCSTGGSPYVCCSGSGACEACLCQNWCRS